MVAVYGTTWTRRNTCNPTRLGAACPPKLSGDFYQLPPVPATASLLASGGASQPANRSYEHQQGRKLLSDMEYVLDFVNMQRFQDPLLVHIVIFTQVVLNLEILGNV